jgi:membrane-bound lytic murein transglycosylase D
MSKLVYFIVPVTMLFSGITWINMQGIDQVDEDLRSMEVQNALAESLAPQMIFCNDEVPTNDPSVKARLDHEMNRLVFDPAGSDLIYNRSLRYRETFERILLKYGVPRDMFYLAIAESNLSNAVSPAGAVGFWQFMEGTARQYGLEVSATVDERYHPIKATHAAARYLRDMHKQFGDWALVTAAYNMGQGRLGSVMGQQGIDSYYRLSLNEETSRYLFRVLSAKNMLEHPDAYGMRLKKRKAYKPVASYTAQVTENIPDLVTFAAENGISYEVLKTLNPWLIASQLEVEPGKTYEVRLPLVEDFHAPEMVTNHWREEQRRMDSVSQVTVLLAANDTIPAQTTE